MYLRRFARHFPPLALAILTLLTNLSLSAASFSDAGGNSPTPSKPPKEPKELIVLLAPGASAPTHAAFVDGVNQGHLPLKSLSADTPLQARFALSDRASGDALKQLEANPDTPRARLERYVVLTYPPDTDLEKVKKALASDPAILHVEENVKFHLSVSPSDPLFAPAPGSYQWGSHVLNLEHAWDRVKGHAYVGLTDTGLDVGHPDLRAFSNVGFGLTYNHGNFRPQFSKDVAYNDFNVDENVKRDGVTPTALGHGTHTCGIIAATPNNGIGVAGACWNCSLMMAKVSRLTQEGFNQDISLAAMTDGTRWLVDHGAQILNASLGFPGSMSCSSAADQLGVFCQALAYADQRDVVMIAASGNAKSRLDFPASDPRVIAVGGVKANGTSWAFWDESECLYPGICGSNYGANQALVAPAKQVVSTFYEGKDLIPDPDPSDLEERSLCGNSMGNSLYSLCTGTSMASPYVAGIAGLLRSANPLLTKDSIRSILISHASNSNSRNDQLGYGVPDADAAVAAAMGQVAGQVLPNRLTPLFSLYSGIAQDYFYTTVPQMALAAHLDNDASYESPKGSPPVPGYNYPGISGCPSPCFFYPSASVYIFTTDAPPYTGAPPLVPLYRVSFKGTNPATGNIHNRDTAYATTEKDLLIFKGLGYELDGIEGYIYQKCSPEPGCIPLGAVRLYRRLNKNLDDYAIFPESELSQMQNAGYTSPLLPDDWIGYVYPNVDSDGDGVIDGFEQLIGTNPHLKDSDCDGVNDGQELLNYGLTGYGDPNLGPCGKLIFADVPPDYWARSSIEAFYAAGITTGCLSSPLSYCPEDQMTRAQMAILLLRLKEGRNYVPPASNCNAPRFKDVPCTGFAADFIEELARRVVITGCGDGTSFCPNDPVTQAQLATFLLQVKEGRTYQPPPPNCSAPRFKDVPCTLPQAAFIEELARRGFTCGCGGDNYCPNALVTRAQAAALLVKAFNLPPR